MLGQAEAARLDDDRVVRVICQHEAILRQKLVIALRPIGYQYLWTTKACETNKLFVSLSFSLDSVFRARNVRPARACERVNRRVGGCGKEQREALPN